MAPVAVAPVVARLVLAVVVAYGRHHRCDLVARHRPRK
jgi:hypothetical protein